MLAVANRVANVSRLLRPTTKINSLTQADTQIRSIRMRKPPWVPKAKSKMFRVPELKQVDQAERDYMVNIWHEYKAQMRSIYQLFKTESKFSDKASLKAQEEKRIRLEKEKHLIELNDALNKQLLEQQLRDESLTLEEKKRHAESEFNNKLKLEQAYVKAADERVKKLKEKAKHFIDPNNLEQEIEKALNQKCDYNFSVDTSGRIYRKNA